jgi:xanthine dehydrogenase accessory factor
MGIYERLAELEKIGKSVVIATIIQSRGSVPRRVGSKMLVFPDGSIEDTIGGGEMEERVKKEALAALQEGKPRSMHYSFTDPERGDPGICGGEIDVLVEPIRPNPTLVVIGAGHVGKQVASLASWMGMRVVVVDDRPGFATAEMVPDADEYLILEADKLSEQIEISAQTYFILTTRSVDIDVNILPILLKSEAAYLGVIGSRRRWETTVSKLIELGIAPEQVERIISPMGLELNAETPEEIAVSILAELIMLRRGGTGARMAHLPVSSKKQKGE